MTRPALLAACLLACACAAVGCGRDRQSPRAAETPVSAPVTATKPVDVPRAGVDLELPRNMTVRQPSSGTTAMEARLGSAFVSVFAYRRTEQQPRSEAELDTARSRLVQSLRERTPGYRSQSADTTELDGARAIELVGTQPLDRSTYRVRSLHVFRGAGEVVVEIGAPARSFASFDRRLRPLVDRSLRVTGQITTP